MVVEPVAHPEQTAAHLDAALEPAGLAVTAWKAAHTDVLAVAAADAATVQDSRLAAAAPVERAGVRSGFESLVGAQMAAMSSGVPQPRGEEAVYAAPAVSPDAPEQQP